MATPVNNIDKQLTMIVGVLTLASIVATSPVIAGQSEYRPDGVGRAQDSAHAAVYILADSRRRSREINASSDCVC